MISATSATAAPPAVPPTMMLTPYVQVLPAGPGAVRIGLDPDEGLIVDRLPEALVPMLTALERPTSSVGWVAEAARLGVPLHIAEEVLVGLIAYGVLTDAEPAALAALRRAQAVVEVRGAETLAQALCAGLTEAGIGQVLCGQSRAGSPGPSPPTTPSGRVRDKPDLVVLAGGIGPEREKVRQLLTAGIDHLVVALREGVGIVGPLTLARRTACPLCVDLARADADPGWPSTSAVIAGVPGTAAPATVSATAALAVTQVVAAIEGAAAAAVDGCLEIDLRRPRIRRRSWPPHPRCTCGAQPGNRREPRSPDTGGVTESEAGRSRFAIQGTIEA